MKRFRQREGLVAVDMDGETVMMCVTQGAYFGLNGSAGLLWEALAQPQDADSLCQRLVATYDIDAATARRDVDAFLAHLQEKSLVVPCD